MAQSGQGTVACVERTSKVICAAASSTAHASRRSVVASGNKRARMVCVCVETKADSSSRRWCLWGNAGAVDHRHQRYPEWVCRYMKYNREGAPDIPKCHIPKSGQEPGGSIVYTGDAGPQFV